MKQKSEDLKRFICHQFDVYKKRLEIIERKRLKQLSNYSYSNPYSWDNNNNKKKILIKKNKELLDMEEMKEVSDIGDISTLLDLLKELHTLDAKLFYDLCSKENTELEDLIFDHGQLNGLDEIYISIKANKQKIIMRQEKYKKLELFYKIKKMKVFSKYQEEMRQIEEEHKIAQLNLTLSRQSRQSRKSIQLTDSIDSNDNIVITGKNLQINDQWEILNMEEIEI